MPDLKKTSLYEKHKELGAKNIGFCGWEMPVQYDGILKEHEACREKAAIFDTSHMGEFFFEGNILFSGINNSVTIDLVSLPIGKCKYGFILNEKGGVIDDTIVYKADEDRLMFVVNASRIDIDFDTIRSQIQSGDFINASETTSKIDLQGPKSKKILETLLQVNLDGLKFFSFTEADILDSYALLSRTGYTGELGYELYVDNEVAPKIWDKLIKLGATPAGLGARDVLRLEMGYSLYGQDLNEDTTPLEAGLDFFVQESSYYTGKEALDEQRKKGIEKKLIAFKTNSKRAPRHGFIITQEEKEIGEVTSGTYSPSVNSGIGLGYVNIKDFDKTKPFEIKTQRGSIPVELTSLPFYKKEK
jgi:aminomethyltransferase